jgi:hypothetical protein
MAERLLRALDLLDPRDASTSAGQVGMARGQEPFQAIWNEENKRWLANSRDCIETIATAAKRPLKKPTRGQPCNIPAYLMMMDIAAIFEYLTDTRATRTVDWKTREETGPFRDFAGAIWSVVFSGADGLSAALKNWAEAKKKYAEPSLLMANIAMRHPEWGLFGPF